MALDGTLERLEKRQPSRQYIEIFEQEVAEVSPKDAKHCQSTTNAKAVEDIKSSGATPKTPGKD